MAAEGTKQLRRLRRKQVVYLIGNLTQGAFGSSQNVRFCRKLFMRRTT